MSELKKYPELLEALKSKSADRLSEEAMNIKFLRQELLMSTASVVNNCMINPDGVFSQEYPALMAYWLYHNSVVRTMLLNGRDRTAFMDLVNRATAEFNQKNKITEPTQKFLKDIFHYLPQHDDPNKVAF